MIPETNPCFQFEKKLPKLGLYSDECFIYILFRHAYFIISIFEIFVRVAVPFSSSLVSSYFSQIRYADAWDFRLICILIVDV